MKHLRILNICVILPLLYTIPVSGEEFYLIVFSEHMPYPGLFKKPFEDRDKDYLWIIPSEEVNQDGLQSIHVYPFVIDWFDEYPERGSFAPYWLDAINYPNDRASIKGSSDKKAFYQVIKKQSKTIQHFSFSLPAANFKKKIKISVSVLIISGDINSTINKDDNRKIYYSNKFTVKDLIDNDNPMIKIICSQNYMLVPYNYADQTSIPVY